MPFDSTSTKRIAIIGAGISGLAAAYELSPNNHVTLFESAKRLGGHARTVMAGRNKDVPVDTGFIVFNYPNYPNLTRMFKELDVPVKESDMSFAASVGGGAIEYGTQDFRALTAQTRNMVRPQFWRMLADVLKFNKNAADLAQDPNLTVGQLLNKLDLGEWFRRYYLLPISGAIWSSTPEQMADFPARSLIQFFQNHALMSMKNHQWHTVDGGSIQYVTRIAAAIRNMGGDIRESAPIMGVRRDANNAWVRAKSGEWEEFDEVIFACHSDDALRLLETPTAEEKKLLGNLRYQSNTAVLHRDHNMMPKRRRCWASWVFMSPDDQPRPAIAMTYWMNSLQGIDHNDPLFLTLNAPRQIREELIYDQTEFRHPVFDRAAISAQQELPNIQGKNRTWYCGAYTRWGFHEDGYASAVNVAEQLNKQSLRLAS